MLKSLKLKNFLKHQEFALEFTSGVTVIRGANEAGKSSMLEGILYNWGGAAALRQSIEETVTLGAKKFSLWTETIFTGLDGADYACERGVAGAELRRVSDGVVLVTGHKEVTAKIEQLLGVPAGKARETLFAEQDEVRGVVSLGPTAAAAFIESLGNFDQIDQLLDNLSVAVPNGPTKSLEERLASLDAELAEVAGRTFDVAGKELAVTQARVEVQVWEQTGAALREQEVLLDRQRQLKALVAKLNGHKLRMADLEKTAAGAKDLQTRLSELETERSAALAYGRFTKYQDICVKTHAADWWEGDIASLRAEITDLEAKLRNELQIASNCRADAAALSKGKILSTTCPTCKQTIGDPAVAAAKNAEIDAEVESLQGQALEAQHAAAELQADLSVLQDLARKQHLVDEFLKDNADACAVWGSPRVPSQIRWLGAEIPTSRRAEAAISGDIATTQRALNETDVAKRLLVSTKETVAALEAEISSLGGLPEHMLDEAEILARQREAQLGLAAAANNLRAAEQALAVERAAEQENALRRERLVAARDAELVKLAEMNRNNLLIKSIKAGRLLVMDALWARVMASVSAVFSKFRGVASVVERKPGGFYVDGCKRPSGSTKDILGLALRVALLRTFSACNILFLDEAGAGCDDTRSALITAVLSAAGFDQILMITHKDLDEVGADNLVTI